jgi:SIR2-like domain
MLNADDAQSVLSVRMLAKTAADRAKPMVFWVGAGASRWLGYPSWVELARHVRKVFFQTVAGFDNKRAVDLINRQEFPAFLEVCRNLDHSTYYKTIADAFLPKEGTATYTAFTELLSAVRPLFVLTTNVDEALERALPGSAAIQKTDLSRCVDFLGTRVPFIAKLHGSVSSIRTTVFTTGDYQALANNTSYMASLKHIFTGCTVVFLGYGLRDSYVIQLLSENAKEHDLFGAGPHFAVTNEVVPVGSIRPVRYSLKISPDHSAALNVLRIITQSVELKEPAVATSSVKSASGGAGQQIVPTGKTAYYLSDLMPPGTSFTSQEITAKGETNELEAAFGLGFTNEEVPLRFQVSTAMHDLVVGLLCFDYVYLPLMAAGNLIRLAGEALARELIENDTLRFIHSETQLGVVFAKGGVMGSVGNVILNAAIGSGAPEPLPSRIRKLLPPVPGKEKEADSLFGLLEKRTSTYRRGVEVNVPSLVRGALLMPKVPALLGIGDAIAPTQVPRWLRYPYLRLAHLVETGTFCAEFGIQAAKVPFG